MTRLFLRLYLGVLAILFAAWYIYGEVAERRRVADRARVVGEAHGGGARMVARELDATAPKERAQVLKDLRGRFAYPIEIIPTSELPPRLQRRLAEGLDVSYFLPEGERELVVASLSDGHEVVRLGPFPDYRVQAIEDSLGGWMRLTTDKLNAVATTDRPRLLEQLRPQFYFPIRLVTEAQLPEWPQERMAGGDDVVFYSTENDFSYAVSPLRERNEFIRFGPFPRWDDIDRRAATTTLALVLLPTAFAIALLLRPVARQLRHVENAAEAIAAGKLSTRVDERRTRSALPLAMAFNHMANQTETLLRTQKELLQAVSHELRTPLSRIRFAIDLVDMAKDDAERKERLQAIDTAAEELDELVGELLRYVRMENAEPELDREPVELRDVFETMIHKFDATRPQIEFQMCGNMAEGQTVFADRQGFIRVLGNLLSNASRFAKHQVMVSVSSNGTSTTIDVDDDGEGIPVADRERIFEPFVRLNDGSQNGDGFGLGLALVRRIVAQHGGRVEVVNSPLGGCRMRTCWPSCDI